MVITCFIDITVFEKKIGLTHWFWKRKRFSSGGQREILIVYTLSSFIEHMLWKTPN